jgi:hypothetical protein
VTSEPWSSRIIPQVAIIKDTSNNNHHLSRKLQALAHDARLMQLPCIQ